MAKCLTQVVRLCSGVNCIEAFPIPIRKLMVKTNHTVKLVALATYQQGFQCPVGSAA